MEQVQKIKIADIAISKTNPRKQSNQETLQELSVSIKNQGVLQPVAVRKTKSGKYELVFGQRRLMASKLAKIDTVPAFVREYSDKEVFEIQITENLQRENPHPMDEAKAIDTYISKYKATKEETADFFGITLYKVNKRLQLTNLIKELQEVFLADVITIAQAIIVAQFPQPKQKEIFEESFEDWKDESFSAPNLKWQFERECIDLNKMALFNLEEENIAGKNPCIGCTFNTSTSLLFNTDNNCSNSTCFADKHKATITPIIEKHEKQNAIFVSRSFYSDIDQVCVDLLEELGIKINSSADFESVYKPKKPSLKKLKGNYWMKEWSEEELQERLEKDLVQYNTDNTEFKEKLKSGEYFQAIYAGTLEKVVLQNSKPEAKSKSEIEKLPKKQQVKAQIQAINAREIRAKELDQEKISDTLYQESLENYKAIDTDLTKDEEKAFLLAIYYHLPYDVKRDFVEPNVAEFDSYELTEKQVAKMVRNFVVSALKTSKGNSLTSVNTKALHLCIENHLPETYNKVIDEQQQVAQARAERINARIKKLK